MKRKYAFSVVVAVLALSTMFFQNCGKMQSIKEAEISETPGSGTASNASTAANGQSSTASTVPKTLSVDITTTTANLDISKLFPTFTSPVNLEVTIATNVFVYASNTSTPAITTGNLPSGSTVKIINRGVIVGAGGAGGAGGSSAHPNGFDGLPGGNAVDLTVDTTIDNDMGVIRGGGGGGPGGGCAFSVFNACELGGAGGGGGCGHNVSAGGLGGTGVVNTGGAGGTCNPVATTVNFANLVNYGGAQGLGTPGTYVNSQFGSTTSSAGGYGGVGGIPGTSGGPGTPGQTIWKAPGNPGASGLAIKKNGHQLLISGGSFGNSAN